MQEFRPDFEEDRSWRQKDGLQETGGFPSTSLSPVNRAHVSESIINRGSMDLGPGKLYLIQYKIGSLWAGLIITIVILRTPDTSWECFPPAAPQLK